MKKAIAFSLIVVASIAVALWVRSCEAVEPAELRGPARVLDGDTLKVGPVTVRMAGIDAPEKAQPYGPEAKTYLEQLIDGKQVVCHVTSIDGYGRCIAHVKAYRGNSGWFNDKLVENGFAWHYEEYSGDQVLADAEKLARSERRGLWKQTNPENPADFRAKHKATAKAK